MGTINAENQEEPQAGKGSDINKEEKSDFFFKGKKKWLFSSLYLIEKHGVALNQMLMKRPDTKA